MKRKQDNEEADINIHSEDEMTGTENTEFESEQDKTVVFNDDQDSDSDLEAGPINRTGKVPREWYEEYPHIGYDVDGKKIMKPATADELEKFLAKMDDPKYWRTIHDDVDDKDIVLTPQEIDIIQKLQQGSFATEADPYEDAVDFFTYKQSIHPVLSKPEPKRRFLPSKWEHQKIMKVVRAIRKGLILPHGPKTEKKPQFYDIWNDSEEPKRTDKIPAPKIKLPGHAESYNPPEEYLMTEEEKKEWEAKDAKDRETSFIPRKFDCMRHIPAYNKFFQERFERCLDLYLCPRVRKNRINIDPESLIPKLPDPKELKPFPSILSVVYKGHSGRVRSVSVDPTGQWLVSGSDDNTVKLWELMTGRCIQTWSYDEVIQQVVWNPSVSISLFAVVFGEKIILVHPDNFESKAAEWKLIDETQLEINHSAQVKSCVWHNKGDYFATVASQGHSSKSVLIHQLSKKISQNPFKKVGGIVQNVLFHPKRPLFYVATQQFIRIYDLSKQELVRKLSPGFRWISSMSIHPSGDNIIVGSYDKKVCWIDMELSPKPYKVLRFHKKAVRNVVFHRNYPLFASCSDDGTTQVYHGMVYQDLLQNPLIVPVKILRCHSNKGGLGVLNCQFHIQQPWLVSSGADGLIKLFS
ncbi:BOP1NT-domain-containing protein [Rozella allomycis CSF55]|uniref:Ribosome biogenesis protein ERB1 n=1 Tax=Rozella allomycis (strain CSF55) TaxID=988480 RepID=A0A4P9YLJ8_ROZAC|nr:BOP1NT-domain-containing protein [Rozella allomycis CSF55]